MKCTFCDKEFSKMGIGTHIWRTHGSGKDHKPFAGKDSWTKGLNKSDPRIWKMSNKISIALKGKPGHIPSSKTKQLTSESMKKAHSEGRAWNIGKSRWNNMPSYPEKFFMKVIENEFEDKNYVREYSLGNFSLDFAWVHKSLCIEIDGEQHKRFQEYRERDERKDKFLKDFGWKVLRIEWQKMYKDPKQWIQIAKDFVTIP